MCDLVAERHHHLEPDVWMCLHRIGAEALGSLAEIQADHLRCPLQHEVRVIGGPAARDKILALTAESEDVPQRSLIPS